MEEGWRIALLEFAQMSVEIETRNYYLNFIILLLRLVFRK